MKRPPDSRRRTAVAGALAGLVLVLPVRALEVDCRACAFCRGQPDLLPALEARIRAHLTAGKTASEIARIEGGKSLLRPPVEVWANGQPGAVQPDRKRLKYRGSALPDGPLFSSFEPSIRLNGVCVGTDKLGHFFQQGWEYYALGVEQRQGEARAQRYGEWLEGVRPQADYAPDEKLFRLQPSGRGAGYGGFGRATSGVISHADLAANLAGLHFYQDVATGRFRSLATYITTNWCEELNPNDYTPAMRALVARNQGINLPAKPAGPGEETPAKLEPAMPGGAGADQPRR